MPEWLREFVPDVLAPEADVPEHVVAAANRARSRRRRMAATISRIAANGAICLFLARRVVCVIGTSSDANRVDLCCKAG